MANYQEWLRRPRKPLPGGGVRMNPALETLYRTAKKADDDFQAAVVRQFGAKDAGDARYQYRTFNPATQRAHLKSATCSLRRCQHDRPHCSIRRR